MTLRPTWLDDDDVEHRDELRWIAERLRDQLRERIQLISAIEPDREAILLELRRQLAEAAVDGSLGAGMNIIDDMTTVLAGPKLREA